jgi:hypothetical protein
MGRTDGHQWGDSVAAYGEVFMATVTVVPPSVGAGGLLVNGSFLIATYDGCTLFRVSSLLAMTRKALVHSA